MTEKWGQADSMLVEQWTRIRAQLRAEVGDAAFNSWLKPLTLGEMLGDRLRIAVPTRFMRDWIEENYGPRLTEFWQEENSGVAQVEIIVEPTRTNVQAPGGPPQVPIGQGYDAEAQLETGETSPGVVEEGSNDSDDVRALLDKRFVFKNFIVGRTNELAHAAARRVAESDGVPF
ncbi:MAG: DnaA/Hda family protein, partial [Alphaproteobacteria bacterium]|nr:DnaA/Hda family protein [Alphaproteobacteria bacterium]